MIKSTAAFVDRWDWVLLGLAAPLLLFPAPMRTPALLIVPFLWLAAWIARGRPVERTPLNLPLLLLSGMMLVSLYATFDIAFSLPKISGMVLGLGAFFAVSRRAAQPHQFWQALVLFLGLGLAIAIASLFGTAWAWKIPGLAAIVPRVPRIISGLPGAEAGFNANEVAGTLLWIIPLYAALTILLASPTGRSALGVRGLRTGWALIGTAASGLLILAVFLLAQSRGAIFALALTPVLLLPAALRGRARRIVIALLIILALALYVAAVIWPAVALYLIGVVNGLTRIDLATEPIQGRLETWSRAIYGIQDFPFTGMGMNAFRRVVHVLYPLFLVSPDTDIGHAHNEFLQAALDLGIPGLIAFLAVYLTAFWMLVELWRGPTGEGGAVMTGALSPVIRRALVLGLGGGLLAHFMYGLLDAVALGAKPGVIFWMLLGLITGLHSQGQASARDSSRDRTTSG